MGKRKIFAKIDLRIPQIEYIHDAAGKVIIPPDVISSLNTVVEFGRNPSSSRRFDFARWYGVSIDPISYACQRQIERFLAGQDGAPAIRSIVSYCTGGICNFLDYCVLRATAFDRELTLWDVSRELIDGYLGYLAGLGINTVVQKTRYAMTKSVLLTLSQRGLIPIINHGDDATFPRNPFPNINRKGKGETGLSKSERDAITIALRQAIKPIWAEGTAVTGELLAYALLIVALHTGRNTTPLLEMGRNCLRPHPKENTTFLVLWKRRGYNTSKVALRAESETDRLLDSTPSVRTNVERLIRRVMALTEPMIAEAPDDLNERLWLYRSRTSLSIGQVTALNGDSLNAATYRLVAEYSLTNSDGQPLRLNISRLRKTFANRIFELTDADIAITAAALGNSQQVADRNYLASDENARRNWRVMGEILVQELQSRTIGATYSATPMGHCADPVHGQYAPKREGATCISFLNCLRCKHYAVTAEDLYKLFSFYFRVLTERSRMDKRVWSQGYAHIPRLIDNYIVAEGLRRGIFKTTAVEMARERARSLPHPFWSLDLIERLEVFT